MKKEKEKKKNQSLLCFVCMFMFECMCGNKTPY